MEVDFNSLIIELRDDDDKGLQTIRSHIAIILSRWAKHERIELDWIASEDGIGDPESIFDKVYLRFRNEIVSGNLEINNYQAYKEAILRYGNEVLGKHFEGFYHLISGNEPTAWKKVNERLLIYAAKWLADRNIMSENAKEIFQESMLTLIEKIAKKNLRFDTSRELKSYFFRIIELKTFEYQRKENQYSMRSAEMDLNALSQAFETDSFEEDDRYNLINKIMRNSILDYERYILKHYYFYGEKLSEIARALQISAGNCRQKKFQALKKIAEAYQKFEAAHLQIHYKERRD